MSERVERAAFNLGVLRWRQWDSGIAPKPEWPPREAAPASDEDAGGMLRVVASLMAAELGRLEDVDAVIMAEYHLAGRSYEDIARYSLRDMDAPTIRSRATWVRKKVLMRVQCRLTRHYPHVARYFGLPVWSDKG